MQQERASRPIVIAHRGASGYLPEHTLAAYAVAIEQGADFIEPDLVMTRDGVLVARHENALAIVNPDGSLKEATTDVADHVEFADRKSTKTIDGQSVTGWFTEDFRYAELRELRACERIPQWRAANVRFDGSFSIPSFAEILDLAETANQRREQQARRLGLPLPAPVGVYPETKHPTYFKRLGLPMEQALVTMLHDRGYRGRHARVFIQSFEVGNLQELRKLTDLPLIQLIEAEGQPYDFSASANPRTYADMVQPDGLRAVATYADGIGVAKELIIPRAGDARLLTATSLVSDAHAVGLQVHAWTFRAENHFLPQQFRQQPTDVEAQAGDLTGEIRCFLQSGIDGLFVDYPDIGVRARNAFQNGY